MKRKIINIDREKCNGCGLCVQACHEGAIQLVDGKAALISDIYCDGLGDCLPVCPTNAIQIIEREAEQYSDEAVKALKSSPALPCGCPGTMAKKIDREKTGEPVTKAAQATKENEEKPSELSQWPVQLKLVNPKADYFNETHLLVAADCTAFAYGNFHQDFIQGHTTVIGCPKLDDNQYYQDKLTEILSGNRVKSITVVRMEVPCCSGIVNAVKEAMLRSKTIVPYREVVIGIDGTIKHQA